MNHPTARPAVTGPTLPAAPEPTVPVALEPPGALAPTPDIGAAPGQVSGWHFLAELHDCDPARLDGEAALCSALVAACEDAGATVLGTSSHQFRPYGVTAVVLLAESHMAAHTWPEAGYAAVDIFTCGERMRPERAIEVVRERLGAGRVDVTRVSRGSR